jgi:hypothetical protein
MARGAFDAAADRGLGSIRKREVFAWLASVFGWYGEEARLLAMWMQIYPSTDHCTTHEECKAFLRAASEEHYSDPYARDEAFWERCSSHGYDSFMAWWGYRNPDQFADTVALLDETAKALGDE